MDDIETLLVGYMAVKLLKKRKRKWWVHPINSDRHLAGTFCTLFSQLRQDTEKFFNYFRMSEPSFLELLTKIKDNIRHEDTNMRCAIAPEEMLAVTLRYLGSGCSLQDLHYSYRIGKSTASNIVRMTCKKIWEVMKDECFPKLTEDKWKDISQGFASKANFPNCLGAVDGKHVRIVRPGRSASLFYNYKHFFSVILLAVADSEYRFVYITVGSYGKEGDSTIFKDSDLWKKLNNGTLNIPCPSSLPGINMNMPYAFVGDEAFALSPNILRPYSGTQLEEKKRVFNYRLSRARRYVECSFGILANKWRIFHRPINVKIDFVDDIIKCCCVLHNYVRERDGYKFEDTLTVQGLQDLEFRDIVSVNRHVNTYRDTLANYFVSEHGEVPWQYNM